MRSLQDFIPYFLCCIKKLFFLNFSYSVLFSSLQIPRSHCSGSPFDRSVLQIAREVVQSMVQ
uniref:Uncharacterized protein n=1 Tax=Anguilla anguilla TaxID=7936 RepID=A0A0E9XJ86_ANGAN